MRRLVMYCIHLFVLCVVLQSLHSSATLSAIVKFSRDLDAANKSRSLHISYIMKPSKLTSTSHIFQPPLSDTFKFNSSRIAGGYFVSNMVAKRLAYVYVQFFSSDAAVCSGSILNSRLILCAAHCFGGTKSRFDVSATHVRIGRYNDRGRWYPAESVYIHKYFNLSSFQNDVALIRIAEKFKTPYGTVRLPNSNFELPVKSTVYAAGFGRTSHNGPSSSEALEVKLRYQNYYRCRRVHPYAEYKYWSPRRILCATDPNYPNNTGSDTCRGDSGGPLYLKRRSTIIQQGITSFGEKCAVKGSVVWYTNLKTYTRIIRLFANGTDDHWRNVYDHRK